MITTVETELYQQAGSYENMSRLWFNNIPRDIILSLL
jgi:hypothetical protein